MMKKTYNKTEVITANFMKDWFQGIRNLLGLQLISYEKMIDKKINEMIKQMKKQGKINWYRLSINELTNGAVMITIYGEII